MSKRGFTLLELLTVVSLTSIIAAATGLLYLEIRTAGVLTEAQVALERRAALSLEWLARDLREGALAEPGAGGEVRIRGPRGPVRYRIDTGRLVRSTPTGDRLLTRHARALTVTATSGGHRAELRMRRTIRRGRRLRLTRRVFVGARR